MTRPPGVPDSRPRPDLSPAMRHAIVAMAKYGTRIAAMPFNTAWWVDGDWVRARTLNALARRGMLAPLGRPPEWAVTNRGVYAAAEIVHAEITDGDRMGLQAVARRRATSVSDISAALLERRLVEVRGEEGVLELTLLGRAVVHADPVSRRVPRWGSR